MGALIERDNILRFENRTAWLQHRPDRIGASQSPGICNASRWITPLSVYTSIVLGESTTAETTRLKIGHLAEPMIGLLYEDETGNKGLSFAEAVGCEPGQEAVVMHPELSFVGSTPDWIVPDDVNGRGLVNVQMKTLEPWIYNPAEPEADGPGDEPPVSHQIQVQHEMSCLPPEVEWTDIVTLIGLHDIHVQPVRRDPEFIASIMKECAHFWHEHVEPRIPPAAVGNDVDRAALSFWRPQSEDVFQLPEEFSGLDTERLANAAQMKALKDRNDTIKAEVKQALIEAGATVGVLPDGRKYSWAQVERKEYTVAASSYDMMRTPRKPKGT